MAVTDGSPAYKKYLPAVFISILLVAISICEWIFAYQDVAWGIILALVIALAVYLVNPLIHLGRPLTNSIESLVLIPLYILFTSSLPWFFLSKNFLLPAVYSAVLVLCFWHIYRKRINLGQLGFSRKHIIKYTVIGLLSGIPLGIIEYFIITPVASFPTFEFQYLLRDFVYMIVFVGLGEELLFRALVQRDLSILFGWKWGLVLTSIIFGVMHLTWGSVLEVFYTASAGLVFGYLYHKTESLTAPIIAHGAGNTILVAVMPYILPK